MVHCSFIKRLKASVKASGKKENKMFSSPEFQLSRPLAAGATHMERGWKCEVCSFLTKLTFTGCNF